MKGKKNGLTFCSPQSPFKVQNHLVWVFCGLEAPDESPQSSVVVVFFLEQTQLAGISSPGPDSSRSLTE